MSNNLLKNWIQSNPELSLGLETMTDGEQTLHVIESPDASISDDVAEMVEVKITQDEIERDTDALVEAQESLEAYSVLIMDAMTNGGVTAQSAGFMRQGLERYEELFGVEPMTPSTEAFGGSASQAYSSAVSLESISSALKKGWEALKRAMAALMNVIQDVYARATDTADRLSKRATAKAIEFRRIQQTEPSSPDLEIKKAALLFADGEFVGRNVDMTRGFVHYMTGKYREDVQAYVDRVAASVGKYEPDAADAGPQINSILDIDGLFDKFEGSALPANDTRFGGDTLAKRTAIMAGNKAMYIARPDLTSKGELAELSKLSSKLQVSMLDVTTAKAPPESYTLKVSNPKDLAGTATRIAAAAAAIHKSKKDSDAIKASVDKLVKAGDSLRERADKAELTEEQKRTVNALLRGLSAVQKLLGSSVTGAISYGVSVLNAQLRLVERQASFYAKGTSQVAVI